MAVKSSLKNMVLCLTLVCLFCAAVLGCVYAVTYEPIKLASQKALEASINVVLPEGGQLSEVQTADVNGQAYDYYVSDKDGQKSYAVKSTVIGFGGPLTVMVGVLQDGTVYNTSVLACNETPGLGAKCTDDKSSFRTQFNGFSPEKKLQVVKDGGDVDAITASTITSRAFTQAVANAVNVVKFINGEQVDTSTGASMAEKVEGGQSNE